MSLNEALNPLVSIVLPTYNRAARLERSVRSGLAQTHTNIEIIIVDDGSTDATPEVAARLQAEDSRVRCVRQQNERLPAALNRGFSESRGEYLTWTSDDNTYHPEAIATMVEALQKNTHAGLVYCDYNRVDSEGVLLGRRMLAEPDRLWFEACVGACFLYRREVYEKVGDYDRNLFLAEDYDYWLRVQKHFTMIHLRDIAPYDYACHDESLTSRRRYDIAVATVSAQLKNAPNPMRRLRIFLATRWVVAEGALNSGNRPRAIGLALFYAVTHPWKQSGWNVLQRCIMPR